MQSFLLKHIVTTALLVALIFMSFMSLLSGPISLSLTDLWARDQTASSQIAQVIFMQIRLPRILLAVIIGWGLGLAGAAIQGLLRNPLAEPMILGTGNAAALGAVLVIYIGFQSTLSWAVPVAASGFGVLSVLLLLGLMRSSTSSARLILAGFAMSAFCGALISLALNLSPNVYAALEIAYWLLGSLENKTMSHVLLGLVPIAVGSVLLFLCGRGYGVLSLGAETAQSLGVSLRRLQGLSICGVALICGGVVAVAGVIGFVGLVVPHIIRPFYGHHPQRILLPSALLGALLVLSADTLIRYIQTPVELKLGVITALMGVPFFLFIIFRHYGHND